MKAPLNNIRVIEIGNAIAGPLCCTLLGDMGADVIKVEIPGRGDDARKWGELVSGESPYFIQYNRNKKSITLDIKKEEGKRILLMLLDKCDVIVENFRPGTMDRLGLSYKSIRRRNPRIVYCSISGFGQYGPYHKLGGYDAIIQAMSGLMAVNGEEGMPPLRVGVPITDIIAALYAAYSVTLALLVRERTGKGQHIDVSLYESGICAVAQWITIHSLTKKSIVRFGNRYPLLAPYELFQTKDEPLVIAIGNEEQWKELCTIIGREELVDDPRFRTNSERIKEENRKQLIELISSALKERGVSDWLKLLWEKGIPAGKVNKIEELREDKHLRERGVFVNVKHPVLGYIEIVAPIPKLSETPGSVRMPAPILGEHTEQVLLELGISREEIDELRRRNVI